MSMTVIAASPWIWLFLIVWCLLVSGRRGRLLGIGAAWCAALLGAGLFWQDVCFLCGWLACMLLRRMFVRSSRAPGRGDCALVIRALDGQGGLIRLHGRVYPAICGEYRAAGEIVLVRGEDGPTLLCQ